MSAMRPIDHRRRAVSAGGRISSERVPLSGLFPAGPRLSSASSQTSEAEIKYRRWLALSENQAEKQELVRQRLTVGIQAPKAEMKYSFVKQTKASLLRRDQLPTPPAQLNYREMAKMKKNFEKRKHSLTTSLIMASNIPGDQTPHQFFTGSRYNSAHHIDSRSLMRLGVYVPRGDISRVFVNPAGTIPPSRAIYGRVNHWSALQLPANQLGSPFIPPLTSSHPLLSGDVTYSPVERCISPGPGMEISDSGSVVVQVEEQTELASQLNHQSTLIPLNSTSNDDKTLTKRWLETTEPSQVASAPLEDAHVSATMGPSPQLEEREKEEEEKEVEEDDEDSQLMVSAEAQQLTEEILQQSLTSLNSSGSSTDSRQRENDSPQASSTAIQPLSRDQHKTGKKLRNETSCQTVAFSPVEGDQPSSQPHSQTTRDTQVPKEIEQPRFLDTQIPKEMEQDQSSSKPELLQESTDKSVVENTVTTRSGSTIFINLAKLQDNPPTD